MMDSKCITSIVNFVKQTDFVESCLLNVEVRPIECGIDEEGKASHCVHMILSDSFGRKAQLSEAWVASNLLLFSVFDGYLENKYALMEGASFKNHFDNIPERNCLDKICKNCYRVFKIIRNGIQHNLSNVVHDKNGYFIDYTNRNTHYKLRISAQGIRYLYTLVVYIIQNRIDGLGKEWSTIGHYEGILSELYNLLLREIQDLNDEIGQNDLHNLSDAICVRAIVRYPVVNPTIIEENGEFVVFAHIENNGTDDESSPKYCYSTDYKYGGFLLPQEIGVITKGEGKTLSERMKSATIKFRKLDCCTDRWKVL